VQFSSRKKVRLKTRGRRRKRKRKNRGAKRRKEAIPTQVPIDARDLVWAIIVLT